MIGIASISTYFPGRSESNSELARQFDLTPDFLESKIGVSHRSIRLDGQETSDLCIEAFRRLQLKTNLDVESIDCLAVCTQNPDAFGLPHTAAIVHGKLGLPDSVATFDVSLGCSGYVHGISIVKGFMEAAGLSRGIFITADPYSKIINLADKNTSLLFGDASTATLLTTHAPWAISRSKFSTSGKEYRTLIRTSNGLEMNGRGVFSYVMKNVPQQIEALIKESNLMIQDIDSFVLHQGSKYIIDTLINQLKLPKDRTPIKLNGYGNTVSSSIPIILEEVIEDPTVNRILACGFGVGMSSASTILDRAF